MSSNNNKDFKTKVSSKGAGDDVYSQRILLEPDSTDHILTVTADSSCTNNVNVELEMSPDGTNWCPAVTKVISSTTSSSSSIIGNEEYTTLVPDPGEFKNKHARGGLNFETDGSISGTPGSGTRDFLHQFMGVDKSFNYSQWFKTAADPSATYKPVLFRHGGKDTYSNTKALELTKAGNKTQNLALQGEIISTKGIQTDVNSHSSGATRYRDWYYDGVAGKINPFPSITGLPSWTDDQFGIHLTMKFAGIGGLIELFTLRDSSTSARMQLSINGDQIRFNNNDGSGNWFNTIVDLGAESDVLNKLTSFVTDEYFDLTVVSRGDLSTQPNYRFGYDIYINGIALNKVSSVISQSSSGTVNTTTLANSTIDEITIGGSYESQSSNGSFSRGNSQILISEMLFIDTAIDEDKVKELYDTKDKTKLSFYSDVTSLYRMGDGPGDHTPVGTFYDVKDSDRKFTAGAHMTGTTIYSLLSTDNGYKVLNALENETAPTSKFSIGGWFNSTATPAATTSIMSNQGASTGFDLKLVSPTELSLAMKAEAPYTFTKSYVGQMSDSTTLKTPWDAGSFVGLKNVGWLAEFDNGGLVNNSGASGNALWSGDATDTYNYSFSFWCRVAGTSNGANDWNTVVTQTMEDYNGYIQAFSIVLRRLSSTTYDIGVFWIKNNQRHQVRWYDVGTNGNLYGINRGVWEHISLTFDGDKNGMDDVKLYVDGVDQGSTDFDSTTLSAGYPGGQVTQVAFLGKLLGYSSNNLNYQGNGNPQGQIEVKDFGCWNKTLSPTEVTEAYNAGVPFDLTSHSANSDLVRYFRFREGTGDTLTQVVDQKNSGFICDETNLEQDVEDLKFRFQWVDIDPTDAAYVKTAQTTTLTYTAPSAVNAGNWHNILLQKSTTNNLVTPGTDFNLFLDGEKLTPNSTAQINISDTTLNGSYGFTIAGDGQQNNLQTSPTSTDASAFKAKFNNWSVHTEDVLPSMVYRGGKASDLTSLATVDNTKIKYWWELNDDSTDAAALDDTQANGDLVFEEGDSAAVSSLFTALTSSDSIISTANIDGNAITMSLVKNFNFSTSKWDTSHTHEGALCVSFNGFQERAEYFALFKCTQTLAGEVVDICDGDWHNVVLSYRGQEDFSGHNVSEGDIVKFGPGSVGAVNFHFAVSYDGQSLAAINSGLGADFIGGSNTLTTDTYGGSLVNVGFPIYNRHLKFVGASSDTYQVHAQFSAGINEVAGVDNENAFQGGVDETSFHSDCWWVDQSATVVTPAVYNGEKPATIYGNTTALTIRGVGTAYPTGKPYPLNDPSAIGSNPGGNQYINPNRYDVSTNPKGGLEGWWRWGDTPGDCSITINDVKDHNDAVNNRDIDAFGIVTADRVDMDAQGSPESIYLNTSTSGGGTSLVISFPQIVIENVQAGICNLKNMASPILQYLRVKWTGGGSCDLGPGKGQASINYRNRRKR